MRDTNEIYRDIFISLFHPKFRGMDTIDALRELKKRRRGSV